MIQKCRLLLWAWAHLWWTEANSIGSLHIWEGTISAEQYMQVLEQHRLPSRQMFVQGRPCLFQQGTDYSNYNYNSMAH